MQVALEQLTSPKGSGAIALVGPAKTGKSAAFISMYGVLQKLRAINARQPTKMFVFDLDDGSEPIVRAAREGRWTYAEKPGTHKPWLDDLVLFRYGKGVTKVNTNQAMDKDSMQPSFSKNKFFDFLTDFNRTDDYFNPRTLQWRDDAFDKAPGAILVDSMTELSDNIWDYHCAIMGRKPGSGEAGKVFTYDDWESIKKKLTEVVLVGRAFPCFSVFCFHETLEAESVKTGEKDDRNQPIMKATGPIYRVMVAIGQLRDTLPPKFAGIFYSRSEGGNYYWLTRPNSQILSCGTRGKDGLPPQVAQDFSLVLDV